jgi:predicted secreted hydrolase
MAKMTPGEALTAWLDEIPGYLQPAPDVWALMREVAAKVSTAQQAAVLYTMLGEAQSWGQAPAPTSVQFPQDHRMHLKSGSEWYWLSCHLDAQGPKGPVRIAILQSMERLRLLSQAAQAKAEWTDEECQVLWNAVTVVVSGPDGSSITRRTPNTQWSVLGGHVVWPGELFEFAVGPDSQSGSVNVLPLHVKVDDRDNITLDLQLFTDMPATSAFFLQGEAGITPVIPGIYYSWPQLKAFGRVAVGDQTYEGAGGAWLDHQLMVPPVPAPGTPTVPGFNGWSWCEFNLANGDSFTAAAFQKGALSVNDLVPYGFYLRRAGDAWNAEPILGGMAIDQFIPTLNQVIQPTTWSYTATNAPGSAAAPFDVVISAAPWILDGSFVTGDLGTPSEVPVSVALVDRAVGANGVPLGQALTGVGYCESVSYEPRAAYMARAEAFLRASLR